MSMSTPTQEQMFYAAERASADTLQQALWLAGLDVGNPNPNPLTRGEVEKMALDKRRDSWAFEAVLRVLDNQPPSEDEEQFMTDDLKHWAAVRETDETVAEAIHYVAGGDTSNAARIWCNPSDAEWLAIWERVTRNGLTDASEYRWGAGTLADAKPFNEES
jgi:hypothetical protein